jgi:hypothetical protein
VKLEKLAELDWGGKRLGVVFVIKLGENKNEAEYYR